MTLHINAYQLSDTLSAVTSHTSGILPNKCLLLVPHPLISLSLSVNCEIVNTDYKSVCCCFKHTAAVSLSKIRWCKEFCRQKLDIFMDFCAYSQRREHFEFSSDMIINVTFNLPYTTYIQSLFFFSTSHPSMASKTMASSAPIQHINPSYCRWSLGVFHLCVPEGHNECLCWCLFASVYVCVPLIPRTESEPRVAVCG